MRTEKKGRQQIKKYTRCYCMNFVNTKMKILKTKMNLLNVKVLGYKT